jgi:hypothetical protein
MTGNFQKSRLLYGLLLLAYPHDFRQRFGTEMVITFSDQVQSEWERNSLAGVVRVWRSVLWELISLAVPLQLQRSMVVAVLLSSAGSSAIFWVVFRATFRQCSK